MDDLIRHLQNHAHDRNAAPFHQIPLPSPYLLGKMISFTVVRMHSAHSNLLLAAHAAFIQA